MPESETLGIDEIALKKGHQDFVAITSGLTAKHEKFVLEVLKDRKEGHG